MKAAFLGYVLIVAVLAVGCKSSHEDVVRTEQKSQERVNEAQKEVAEAQREGAEEVDSARARGDIDDMIDEKEEATKELADAESNVDRTKVEATEDIAEAKREAGETTGTLRKE